MFDDLYDRAELKLKPWADLVSVRVGLVPAAAMPVAIAVHRWR